MRVGISKSLPLKLTPVFDSVWFDNDLDRKYLLKACKIDKENYSAFLTHDVDSADISIETKLKPFYKAKVLFSANREDLIRYTQMFDEIFDIHPVYSMKFEGIEFMVESKVDWVVFTSKRAVEFFFKRVGVRYLCDKRMAAIGDKTAQALIEKGFRLDYVPGDFYGEALVEFLKDKGRLLIITAEKYNKIYDELDNVLVVPAYRNVIPEEIGYFKPEGEFDFGLFSSPSAFWHLKEAFGSYDFAKKIKRIIAIGKTTKSYIESCGFEAEIPEKAGIDEMFKYILGE
ncbi:uroporphyrinogen-III synthase [Hippea alviniae]|uniref:uroporphyrinogen-III synthase n=1 Tax=Hippea alviniae TaxID=1279027 RepID=UPI0003B5B103|nr:uroporphyrinogen-III synthase [Hippea alviniae]